MKYAFAFAFAFASMGLGQTVDFRTLEAQEVDVDMMGQDEIEIVVPSEIIPTIIISNGPLAQCEATDIEKIDSESYRFRVIFDPILDDGINACTVTVAGSERARRVKLSVLVET